MEASSPLSKITPAPSSSLESSVLSPNKNFKIGPQPEWAGIEKCKPVSVDFIKTRLACDPADQLISHGYALVSIDEQVQKHYGQFCDLFKQFIQQPLEYKQKFASVQFHPAKRTPNQFHGYSIVSGLKEQFMFRGIGPKTQLPSPNIGKSPTFGQSASDLYILLDMLCRRLLYSVAVKSGGSRKDIDNILDPLSFKFPQTAPSSDTEAFPHTIQVENSSLSSYFPQKYISSSILDTFHYFNTFHAHDQSDEKFHNNHSSHSDSGLVTAVVCTDMPGLEVYDQKLKCWIALEQHLHEYSKTTFPNKKLPHRQFACIFWSDSHCYLKFKHSFKECMHRVGKADSERYSVVYKMRTSPTKTAPRYQEDYHLAKIQLEALDMMAKSVL